MYVHFFVALPFPKNKSLNNSLFLVKTRKFQLSIIKYRKKTTENQIFMMCVFTFFLIFFFLLILFLLQNKQFNINKIQNIALFVNSNYTYIWQPVLKKSIYYYKRT